MSTTTVAYTRQFDENNNNNNRNIETTAVSTPNNIYYIGTVSSQALPPLPVETPPSRREKFDFIQCFLCTLLFVLLIAAITMTVLDRNGPFGGINYKHHTSPRPKGTTPFYNNTLPSQGNCGMPQYAPNSIDIDVIMKNINTKRRFSRIINGREAVPHSWP
jgi:hypothetical protein